MYGLLNEEAYRFGRGGGRVRGPNLLKIFKNAEALNCIYENENNWTILETFSHTLCLP